jgi:chromosome segregation ATPase
MESQGYTYCRSCHTYWTSWQQERIADLEQSQLAVIEQRDKACERITQLEEKIGTHENYRKLVVDEFAEYERRITQFESKYAEVYAAQIAADEMVRELENQNAGLKHAVKDLNVVGDIIEEKKHQLEAALLKYGCHKGDCAWWKPNS